MDRVKRRALLTFAALSPGVVSITLQEMAVSVAFMALGVFGALSIAAATLAVFPQIASPSMMESTTKKAHPSLLLHSSLARLAAMAPAPTVIRAHLQGLMGQDNRSSRFLTEADQIAMVLSQILARWDCPHLTELTDDQVRELWLVERLMRASPAEAGALAHFFVSPNAMLAMRDALADPVAV